MNFNRRGEYGSTLNAWYPFANAAIQGTQVMFKAMTNRQVKTTVGGMVLFGLANDILNASLSAEDDDGELEYDQLPAYVSERNIILAVPGSDKRFVTVPVPYGFNASFFAGQQMGKILRGVKDPGEAAGQIFKTTIEGFAPISGDNLMQAVSPTLLDIGLELYTNEDWLGRPIRPENPYGDFGPQSYKEFNASGASRAVARGLNAATGGSPIDPGLVDISPEYIDHVAKFLTGGAGRFTGRVVGIAERAVEGTMDQMEAYEIPLARTLFTESGDYLNQTRYFDFREAVSDARAQEKLSRETGIPLTEEMRKLNSLWSARKQAEKKRKEVSERIDAVYADVDLTARQRALKLKSLRDIRNQIYLNFNRAFVATMGPQAE